MTLQQLKYVVTVARTGSMSEASKELFISQPGLTTSIRELETEMGIKIFTRTNKGVVTSNEGERFLGYARQVLEQASLLEGVYKSGTKIKQQFCVSTQHYSMKIIKSKSLTFTELFTAKPHVFVSTDHPLADKKSVTMEELADYPYLSFEQGEHNSFYYSEEIFSTVGRTKNIRVTDRATLFNLLIGLNGYTVCSGVIDNELNGDNITAIPLDEEGNMKIGYIENKKILHSNLAEAYIEALKKHI